MDREKYTQRDELLFPLTEDEKVAFGWEPGQMVFSTRGPTGLRVIPTRDVLPSGVIFYGSIETMEPPPGISEEDWASVFGTFEQPRPGLTF